MSQSRKNILLLVDSFAQAGGTQKFVCELGKVLAERHNVFECSFDAFGEPHVFRSGNPVLTLGVKRSAGLIGRCAGYALKAFRLNRLKQRHRIDVTISHLWPSDLINALSMGRGKRVSAGLVNVVGNQQNAMMLKCRQAVGWIYRRFDMTVAINRDLLDELVGLFGLAPTRCACIYAFVSLRAVAPRREPQESRPRLAWFGRLNRMKNLAPLFGIIALVKRRLPNVQLLVIGDGPHRDELVTAASHSGLHVATDPAVPDALADVAFTGFVTDPYARLQECAALLLTSRSEGFGLVLVEAMSVGLPVIASDCPTGGPHLILDGARSYQPGRVTAEETPYGYLMPIPEVDDVATDAIWTDAIVELLIDEDKRRAMSARCLARAAEFSTERLKDRWFALLDAM